ncbi:hypothetical protein DAPPUDRAFT_241239 [Daphnia pulex]|uniref:Uncharacterized protein n=1 Tax=Daphnia pulex TaxID=6669 RepID=E9GDS5_DAPPU|nr:hypothetical protein DAPPUDRAFT_241239 [Daphnia pulex]|eukprot:EFX82135.1 hypothetical protein DAPPUDRAFT_241239 [Daphnia pulex]
MSRGRRPLSVAQTILWGCHSNVAAMDGQMTRRWRPLREFGVDEKPQVEIMINHRKEQACLVGDDDDV